MSFRYRALTASGAAALQVFVLDGPPNVIAAVLGLRETNALAVDRPTLVRIPDEGDAWLDEAVARRRADDRVELCLHGGLGMADALRACFARQGGEELPTDACAWWSVRTPLAARLAWAAQRPEIPAATVEEQARFQDWLLLATGQASVVLAGAPNAGKSSLLNAWLRAERVTVSPHPGTTRDAVEVGVLMGQGADTGELRLIDTAGLWQDATGVDAAAVARSREVIGRAWRVLWVVDASQPLPPLVAAAWDETGRQDLLLLSHADQAAAGQAASIDARFPGQRLGAFDLARHAGRAVDAVVQALTEQLGPSPPTEIALSLPEARRG